jgi:hypothetical protein
MDLGQAQAAVEQACIDFKVPSSPIMARHVTSQSGGIG